MEKNTYHLKARVIFQHQLASRPITHQQVKRPSNPSSKEREDFEGMLDKVCRLHQTKGEART